MFKDSIYYQVGCKILLICGVVFASRITSNWAITAVAAYGIFCALNRKTAPTVIVFLLLAFLPMVNPALMPRYAHFSMIARLSSLAMTAALIITGDGRQGRNQIPLGILYFYLIVAVISSIEGYCPVISYLKVLNFFVFITGIYVGTKNLDRCPNDIRQIRYTFLALAFIIEYGSLITLFWPSVAYFTSLRSVIAELGLEVAEEVFQENEGMTALFTGVTVHSQFLGPMLACCLGWILCDMSASLRSVTPLHVALLIPIPVLAYMTRSRLALVVIVAAVFVVMFYTIPQSYLSPKIRSRFSSIMFTGVMLFCVYGIVMEVSNGAISRWLRKTNDVASDARNTVEAFTSSRQGLIELNVEDFRKNAIWGSGFQVDSTTKEKFENGQVNVFSASIEKGLLPLMILGETGIVGAIVFFLFLVSFYVTCHSRHLIATSSLFTVYLATNMAEATFFAPSGGGGVEWIVLVVGGFVIDMNSLVDKKSDDAKDVMSSTSQPICISVPLDPVPVVALSAEERPYE